MAQPPILGSKAGSSLDQAMQTRKTTTEIPAKLKSRSRTMSSTMSFSAIFPSVFSSCPGTSAQGYSQSHTRYNSLESTSDFISASPSNDGTGPDELIGSPCSITSEEGYMLGTPSSSPQLFSVARSTDKGVFQAGLEQGSIEENVGQDKGKGKARSQDVQTVGPSHRAARSREEIGSHMTAHSGVGPSREAAMSPHIRPAPIHSYTLPTVVADPPPEPPATDNTSGRSTPTALSGASSIHSRLSDVRLKMKRKGSSMMNLMASKDAERMSSRSRSGTTSSVGTTVSALVSSNSPSLLDGSQGSRRRDIRTKVLGKIGRSSSSSSPGGLKLFKRSKSSTLPLAVTSQQPPHETQPGPPAATPSKSPVGLLRPSDGNIERNDYFAGPIPIAVDARGVAHTSVSHRCITDPIARMPVSPVSPPSHSTLEILPAATVDLPSAPGKRQPCFFDDKLPRELQLQCFEALLSIHKDEYQRALRKAHGHNEERVNAIAFLQKRWVGEMAGRRELFRLMRVSRVVVKIGSD